jgi:uncharacterized alkaline shock family protein YloU
MPNQISTVSIENEKGMIAIAPQVVYALALQAALGTYGVIGIASRYTGQDTTTFDPRRGIEITMDNTTSDLETHITVTLHVIVEYGVRIRSVTSSLQHQIAYQITRSTGYIVDAVYVHVSGLRVTESDF